jgi:mannosyltransferase OCH1-like enzyme
MIPKIIHQIWLGDKSPPMQWINSWKNIQGVGHILWTDKDVNGIDLKNRDKFDYYMNNKVYHGAADILRVEILETIGGFYIDADCKLEKEFPMEYFNHNFVAAEAPKRKKWNYRIANGVMGTIKNGTIIKEYNRRISQSSKIMPPWKTIGGTLLTKTILDLKDSSTLILPSYVFYPKSLTGEVHEKSNLSIASHYHGETFNLY